MKWIKWFLGIVIAGVVTLLPANLLMHLTVKVDMNNLYTFQYWIQFFAVPSLAFGLFLFLSCAFVPEHKKNAGLLVFLMSFIFIFLGAYQHYIDDGTIQKDYIIRYTGFIVCLSLALLYSQKLFRNSNWVSKRRKAMS